jgi:transposase
MTTASSRDFGNLSPNRLSCHLRAMKQFPRVRPHCLWESTAIFFIRAPCQSCSFRQRSGTICSMVSFGNIFPRSHAAIVSAPTSAGSSIGAGGTHAGTPALDTRRVPERFGPYTACYKRFVRWRRSGVWSQIKRGALAATHDAAVQTIDTPTVECISAPPLSLKTGTNRSGDHEAD